MNSRKLKIFRSIVVERRIRYCSEWWTRQNKIEKLYNYTVFSFVSSALFVIEIYLGGNKYVAFMTKETGAHTHINKKRIQTKNQMDGLSEWMWNQEREF